jgi:hypothetical protein
MAEVFEHMDTNERHGVRISGPAASTLAVAHCIVGGARTLTNPAVHGTLIRNGIAAAALGASAPRSRDVFIVLLGEGTEKATPAGRGGKPHLGSTLAAWVNTTFSPRVLRFVGDSSCTNPLVAAEQLPCCSPESNPSQRPPKALQFFWIAHAMKEVLSYERAHDFRYDWVTRLRPDLVVLEPFPALRLLPTSRVYVTAKDGATTWDVLHLVPRALLPAFVSSLSDAFVPHSVDGTVFFGSTGVRLGYGWGCEYGAPETLLTRQWQRTGLPFAHFPFAVTLASKGRFQCDRLAPDRRRPHVATRPLGWVKEADNERDEADPSRVWGSWNGTVISRAEWCWLVSKEHAARVVARGSSM